MPEKLLKMETDASSLENTNQVGGSTPGGGEGGSSHARSYDCSFCKKGFSNAQALGGHMNIHRKDRSSRQTSKDNQIPMDLSPKRFPWYPKVSAPESEYADDRSCTKSKWPWTLHGEIDAPHEAGPRQLPLFVDVPAGDGFRREVGQAKEEEGGGQSSHGSGGEQLDLELRLGPEPQGNQDGSVVLKQFL